MQSAQDNEAVVAARHAVHQNPLRAWAHRLLAISLALAGRDDEAGPAMIKAMEVDQAFSIGWFQSWNPLIHGNEGYVEGMRLAGFPA